MEHLSTGLFFGNTNHLINLNGLIITDTEYTHEYVDWHYRELCYFTFIQEGLVSEGNRKSTYNCTAGSLLFRNWQNAHYNIKPAGYTIAYECSFSDQSHFIRCFKDTMVMTPLAYKKESHKSHTYHPFELQLRKYM